MGVAIEGLPFEAPNDKVADLLRRAHGIIWTTNEHRYTAAAAFLLEAEERSPENHPIRIICLQKLAKIARLEYKYDLALKRLSTAFTLALEVLSVGHPRTLRLLEKMVRVCDTRRCWGTDGHLVMECRREPLVPMVDAIYDVVIARAQQAQLPGLVALLQGDKFYAIDHRIKAGHHYSEANRQLASDDLNRPRLRERLRDCFDDESSGGC